MGQAGTALFVWLYPTTLFKKKKTEGLRVTWLLMSILSFCNMKLRQVCLELLSLKIVRATSVTFMHKPIHHFYLFYLSQLSPLFHMWMFLLFTSALFSLPPCPELIRADYRPDQNTDRRWRPVTHLSLSWSRPPILLCFILFRRNEKQE